MTDTPFQSIRDACRSTGLSQFFLRTGCRNGTVPHVRCGKRYMVNVPELLAKLSGTGDREEAGE